MKLFFLQLPAFPTDSLPTPPPVITPPPVPNVTPTVDTNPNFNFTSNTMTTDVDIYILIGIIISAGIIGGITSYYLEKEQDSSLTGFSRLMKNIFMGIVAASLVPLLLFLLSSNIITNISWGYPDGKMKFLYFGSFCMVASVFARRFIQSVGDKVLADIESIKRKTETLETQTNENAQNIDVMVDMSTQPVDEFSPEQQDVSMNSRSADGGTVSAEDAVKKFLKAGGYMFVEAHVVSDGVSLPLTKVKDVLANFESKGWVRKVTRNGKEAWTLTHKGRS